MLDLQVILYCVCAVLTMLYSELELQGIGYGGRTNFMRTRCVARLSGIDCEQCEAKFLVLLQFLSDVVPSCMSSKGSKTYNTEPPGWKMQFRKTGAYRT